MPTIHSVHPFPKDSGPVNALPAPSSAEEAVADHPKCGDNVSTDKEEGEKEKEPAVSAKSPDVPPPPKPHLAKRPAKAGKSTKAEGASSTLRVRKRRKKRYT